MLKLSRASGEGILIGDNILVVKDKNKICILAPRELNIRRVSKEEVQEIINAKDHPANR